VSEVGAYRHESSNEGGRRLFHDHKPANEAGLSSCWIYRRHAQQGFGATMDPGLQPRVDFRFDSMADLVAAHRETLSRG
jgi:FMN phosphatase YigB (HAD superfamily)